MGLEIKFNPEINFTACVGIKGENGKEGNEKIKSTSGKKSWKKQSWSHSVDFKCACFLFPSFLTGGVGVRLYEIGIYWLTSTVFSSIWEKTKNILDEPMFVRDDELTNFTWNRIDNNYCVRLKIVNTIHGNWKSCVHIEREHIERLRNANMKKQCVCVCVRERER